MWFRNVFLNKVSRSFIDILFLADYPDSTSTTRCRRFHNVHISKVIHFTLLTKSFVVLWEKVCGWTDFKILPISSSLSLDITPKVSLMAHVPGTCKMVDLLKLIHVFKL